MTLAALPLPDIQGGGWAVSRLRLHRERSLARTAAHACRTVSCGLTPTLNELRAVLDKQEVKRLEKYLRKTFRLDTIQVTARPQKNDSAEVNIGDEFIGVIFRDEDEGEVSYAFQMAILDIDLPELG